MPPCSLVETFQTFLPPSTSYRNEFLPPFQTAYISWWKSLKSHEIDIFPYEYISIRTNNLRIFLSNVQTNQEKEKFLNDIIRGTINVSSKIC
jgi:hypothetical protein